MINDNFYAPANDASAGFRRGPVIGECGLKAEDTGFDLWLSKQFVSGRPNTLLKLVAVQAWEREQYAAKTTVSPINKTRFLNELGMTNEDLVGALDRYGWLFLSHLGPRS